MDYGTPAIVFSLMIVSLELVKHCQGLNTQVVSCGSVMKLVNVAYKMRLHSHDVKYGSGSGQQSVTATEVKEDVNSHWVVMGTKTKPCQRGSVIICQNFEFLHVAFLLYFNKENREIPRLKRFGYQSCA
ncbi:unnamed protein product [Darwinula stevensoni]|uniref:MIR domain-containing protein n=1 Tax=Darwinula stevensoni TaxID=69355 RepID=A0A7R8X6J1_9CRUS|nr:unnamed protein product [Darwinula stevensoni]CAG0882161.1 unnamed protein product [Darwinula stevensoni]